jgi:hypothetical protein
MSLVLYNPTKDHALPKYWVHVHQSASGAAVVSGAFAYALTHMLGNASTRIAQNSISIAGLLMAHGAHYFMGEIPAEKVLKTTQTVSEVVGIAGAKATNIASIVASTASAVTIGSTFMVGKMVHEAYKGFRQAPEPENAPVESEEDGNEFVIYEISNTPCSASAEESSEQTERTILSVSPHSEEGVTNAP